MWAPSQEGPRQAGKLVSSTRPDPLRSRVLLEVLLGCFQVWGVALSTKANSRYRLDDSRGVGMDETIKYRGDSSATPVENRNTKFDTFFAGLPSAIGVPALSWLSHAWL